VYVPVVIATSTTSTTTRVAATASIPKTVFLVSQNVDSSTDIKNSAF